MEIENLVTHNAVLYNRNRIELTGISDVVSFSENSVEAEYGEGMIIVEGDNMKIEDFSGENGKRKFEGYQRLAAGNKQKH